MYFLLKNAKLYDEMSIRDRKLLELQSEVNNLDKIVATEVGNC